MSAGIQSNMAVNAQDHLLYCNHLGKCFANKEVLRDIQLTAEPGDIVALLGPNGAGKSTLMGCLIGLLEPSTGQALVFGKPATELSEEDRSRMGYVPQSFQGFSWLRVQELIEYLGQFYPKARRALSPTLHAWADLDPKTRIKNLSGGQRQRLSILLALRHQPDLLILDEPVASLDPVGRRDFLQLLRDYLRDRQATALISSHILSDLEPVATQTVIMLNGAMHAQLSMVQFREQTRWIRRDDAEPWSRPLPEGLQVLATGGDQYAVLVANWNSAWASRLANQESSEIVVTAPATLESAFLAMVGTAA
ncbi:ABC transporter ATP-binding protein [Acidithiobacillus ferrooxidans]|jgi:ABC-2 type transport system ATP-binding protein|uniref:ABC transporter, ATP-binding protein n=3 Tax=Acidithiobacillaceae TaxID=225058 RepID=B7J7S1_ACIF2|nr:ABC transporter related [Acidithiobacillus ferrooxidans ATCC 53993]ACK79534.1 ABC transporter, ATP-binding protein [Acidithiobacillus ferrooxidans ATCC 23270]MBN6744120.1 ABC transporter ATP-binding protein [Acidithiobacillus sp. MC2.2]MBN6747057.1 ABC transporter ATP-binding protein [Acidithiobacillus sp. PG05]MBU2773635.1 ABC transporter ATP-binding protein [Acidithiobacillus ferrooxidans]